MALQHADTHPMRQRNRLPRLVRFRLGDRPVERKGAPRELDYFLLDEETLSPRLHKEVIEAYGQQPKSLRMMLPLELDDDQGADLVWNVYNRAYGSGHGLRCKGTGGDREHPGVAETDDERWAKRIVQVVDGNLERVSTNRWRIPCMGRDCPKYFATEPDPQNERKERIATGHDQDAACRMMGVLRAFLLDPTPGEHPRVLAIAEVATGSVNSVQDIQSGIRLLNGFAGRTAAVPFWLVRRRTKTFHGGRGAPHWTCVVEADYDEAQRFGLTPPEEVFLPLGARTELRALREAPVEYETVRDLLPQDQTPRLAAPDDRNPSPPSGGGSASEPSPTSPDRDEVVAEAQERAASEAPDEPESSIAPTGTRKLSRAEKDAIKQLIGWPKADDPDRETKGRLPLQVVREAYRHFDQELPTQLITNLEERHGEYIRRRWAELQSGVDPDDWMANASAAGW